MDAGVASRTRASILGTGTQRCSDLVLRWRTGEVQRRHWRIPWHGWRCQAQARPRHHVVLRWPGTWRLGERPPEPTTQEPQEGTPDLPHAFRACHRCVLCDRSHGPAPLLSGVRRGGICFRLLGRVCHHHCRAVWHQPARHCHHQRAKLCALVRSRQRTAVAPV